MTRLISSDNRLFVLARTGKRQPSLLEAIGVVLATLVFAVIPGQIIGRMVNNPTVELLAGFVPIYAALWIWLRWSVKRPFWTLGLEKGNASRKAIRGGLIALVMISATAGLAIIPGVSFTDGAQNSKVAALGIGVLTLLSYLVQGPAEEILFRGWLLSVVGARYGAWLGVLLSSVVFSLMHAGSRGISLLGFSNLFLFGIFAAVYALAEGGLWGICVWHGVWNWAMGDLLGFPLDGTPHQGLLFSTRAVGPEALTGGAFGLEGGLACTAIFVIAVGGIVLYRKQ